MQGEIREHNTRGLGALVHPLSPEDSAAMTALRSAVAGMKASSKGPPLAVVQRIMERVAARAVSLEATRSSISGWWARPTSSEGRARILHLHGGC